MTKAARGSTRRLSCLSIPLLRRLRSVYPVTTNFALDELPEKSQSFVEMNYVDGGKFQPDKYQKTNT